MQIIGIIAKRTIKEDVRYLRRLYAFLQRKKKTTVLDQCSAPLLKKSRWFSRREVLSRADLVVVLGGDGTLLKTARCLPERDILVLGVNLGVLGFLTEAKANQMLSVLSRVLKGKFVIDHRLLLRVTLYRHGKKIHTSLALNDAVINQGSFARLIKLRIDIGERKMTSFRADGLIVATPTGSTGHALSAGGPIVHPKIPAMIIVPICPAGLSSRPIVIPHDKEITITIETERREQQNEIGLTLDGQEVVPLRYGDKIKIRESARTLHLVRLTGKNYYQMLREKLRWGEE